MFLGHSTPVVYFFWGGWGGGTKNFLSEKENGRRSPFLRLLDPSGLISST